MTAKSKKQQDDQFVDLPEDRIDQIRKDEPSEKAEKKTRRKSSAPRKTKQDQGATLSNLKGSESASEKVPEKPKPSREDLLADIRQELASEQGVVEKKGFFGRFKDRLKNVSRSKTKEDRPPSQPVSDLGTQEPWQDLVVESKPKKKRRSSTKGEEKAIQEFFSDLQALADVVLDESEPEAVEVHETQPEVQKPGEAAPPPKLPARTDAKVEIDFEKIRDVALQEYDETQVEPTVGRKVSVQEEIRKTIRESKPLERIMIIVVFVLTVGALLFSGVFIIVRSIPISTPTPTVVINLEDMVYPTHLSLPGGWGFNLGQGRVYEGQWSPQGAEWLMGTEISRWVALPWSLQLEAVLRTLKPRDQIELTMSNLDRLVFKVYSIQEMTMEEIQALDPKTPSLLIVLFEEEGDSNTHWVVTALP